MKVKKQQVYIPEKHQVQKTHAVISMVWLLDLVQYLSHEMHCLLLHQSWVGSFLEVKTPIVWYYFSIIPYDIWVKREWGEKIVVGGYGEIHNPDFHKSFQYLDVSCSEIVCCSSVKHHVGLKT